MITIAQIVLWILVLLTAGQVLLAFGFVLRLSNFKRALVADANAPRASVILCLRGSDPFLRDCIHGLLHQDYPDYDVQMIVDHESDPAMDVIRECLEVDTERRLVVQTLAEPITTCSLKCSSLVQVVRALDPSVSFIAQIDADTIPHRTWLRELATALQDERVGAATGNRWYMPSNPSMGSLVRYSWNAAAIVQMYWYRIAWGGTLAIKTSVFTKTDLLDRWSHALCEDTMLFKQLQAVKLHVAFVPSLMMVNREDCGLKDFFSWMCRQLVAARLYHPAWPAVIAHGVLCSLAPWLAMLLAFIGWLSGNGTAVFLSLCGLAIYHLSVGLLLLHMETVIRKIVAAREESTNWIHGSAILKVIVAMQITQVLYGFALFLANRTKSVDWRGVTYRLGETGQVELEEYKAYQPAPTTSNSSL